MAIVFVTFWASIGLGSTSFKVQCHRCSSSQPNTLAERDVQCPFYVRVLRKNGFEKCFPFQVSSGRRRGRRTALDNRLSSAQLGKEKPPKGKFGIKGGEASVLMVSKQPVVSDWPLAGWAWVIPGKGLNWVFIEISKKKVVSEPVSVQPGPTFCCCLLFIAVAVAGAWGNISKTFHFLSGSPSFFWQWCPPVSPIFLFSTTTVASLLFFYIGFSKQTNKNIQVFSFSPVVFCFHAEGAACFFFLLQQVVAISRIFQKPKPTPAIFWPYQTSLQGVTRRCRSGSVPAGWWGLSG